VVIDGPRPGYAATVASAIIFAFIFLAIILVAMQYSGVPQAYYGVLILAYAVFALYILWTPISNVVKGVLVRSVAAKLRISSSGFGLNSPCEYGFVTAWSDGRSHSISFAKHGDVDSVSQALVPETHTIVVGNDGSGRLVFPAFVLKSFPYRGVLVAFAVPIYSVILSRDHLAVEKGNDRADLFLEPTENGFSGYMRYGYSVATKSIVSLSWSGAMFEDPLCECPDVCSLVYPKITEPLVIISPEDFLSPSSFRAFMGLDSVVQGEGNFILRLRMKFPMDAPVEDEITVWSVPRTTV
jgi:hypothetical protein